MGLGSSYIHDPNIEIFMQVNKQYYIAGEYVEGEIYIRVKQPSLYTRLMVNLEGEEYVYWTEGQGRNKRYYRNQYQNYYSGFIVQDFGGMINQGDYIFPFVFLLPAMITGSFFYSKHCFLKYTLKAQLFHQTESRKIQLYSMFLNILQPPRMALGPITSTNSQHSKCCFCCKSYGITSITLNSDKNFVMNGDLIQISGMIDNSRGKKIIKQSKIMFERHRFMVSKSGKIRNDIQEQFQLFRAGQIPANEAYQFNFTARIPDNLLVCTAIGRIVSMYYILRIQTQYGCCANKPDPKLHLIVHSRNPMVIRPKILPQPVNWYPQTYQKVVYQNMAAYLYNPEPTMPFLNLPTNNMMMGPQNMVNSANLMSEMDTSQTMINQNWGDNHVYKPVFYNDELISDAQKQYMQECAKNGNQGKYDQNQIFRKL